MVICIEWIKSNRDVFSFEYDDWLEPSSKHVINPLKLENIQQGVERVVSATDNNENIVVFADCDCDGLASAYIMYDYLKNKLNHKQVKLMWNERSVGHGISHAYKDIPREADLVIAIDSSTSDAEACKYISEFADVVIIDHHIPERDNKYALIINPQLHEYPNKYSSATLLTFKFVELMDYKMKKVDMSNYLDVCGMSLMSDQMDLTIMENRYFVYHGMKNIRNVGLLALVHEMRKQNEDINSQIMNYNIIPILNTVARNDELEKGFKLLLERDFDRAKRMAKALIADNNRRKEDVEVLVNEYMDIIQDERFAYVVTKNSSKGYNGLCASKISSHLMKPCLVLKDSGEYYSGSGRTYGDFDMRSFVIKSGLIEYAAGHPAAFGFSIKAENWDEFKQYINDNVDDGMFTPSIEYDVEIDEDDIDWDIVDKIMELDHIWGNNCPPVRVRVNNVFVEDRELFPPANPSHVKIKTDKVDMLKFNDSEYANDVGSWDSINCVGSLGINKWGGNKQIQLFIEDYQKL